MAFDKEKKVIIKASFNDEASSGIAKMGNSTKSATSAMKLDFKSIGLAVAAVTLAIGATTVAITNMASRAGKVTGIKEGFQRSFGDATKSLEKLRESARGTVSDFNLMRSANKASLLGVTGDVDKLAGLMTTARLRARELGIDTTQAFDDIVTGIGRQSPLILDNLGIKIPDAIKKTMEGMTEAEQSQVLLNYAIKDGMDLAKEYGEVQLTSADRAEILQAKIENLKDKAVVAIASPLGKVIDKLSGLIDYLDNATKSGGEASDELSGLKEVLTNEEYGLFPAIGRVNTAWGQLMKSFTGENMSALETLVTMFAGWSFILGKVADGITAVIFGVTDLISKVKQLKKEDILSGTWSNPVSAVSSLFKIKGTAGGGGSFATGGITSGGMTMVHRDELIDLPKGSHVYNKEDSKRMLGNGDIVINVNAPVTGVDNLKATILEAVNEATARQNRLANYNLL